MHNFMSCRELATQSCPKLVTQRILNKTKTTRGFSELVQSHDNSFHISSTTEQFMDLLFCSVEGEIPNIKGTAGQKSSLLINSTSLQAKMTYLIMNTRNAWEALWRESKQETHALIHPYERRDFKLEDLYVMVYSFTPLKKSPNLTTQPLFLKSL